MAAFQRSEAEIRREIAFVGRKIREYRFRTCKPPLPCETDREIRWNRKALLETLTTLGPNYLASELKLPRIHVESLDHPGTIAEVAHRTGARVTT